MDKIIPLFSLNEKVALITGGYRGLGAEIARALAEAGAVVYLNGRSSERVEESVKAFRAEGLDAHSAVFDVTDEEASAAAVDAIVESRGHIDILVNNAGIQRRSPLVDMALEDFKAVIDTNLTAAFILGKAVASHMIKQESGKIINICSLMSDLARPTIANYAAAKGGIRMLTRSMAGEWASHNIQANGIGPGYFETEMTQVLRDNPEFDSWLKGRTPSGRWGKPEDLKGLAVFLASPASNYVNGQLIYIDGGLTAVV
ncbi:KR domain superfamily [Verrucomicrobiia bacterium DG1235]|nr:KR domain superfamily [Verrucomicrobiae bacterium DG1235]